MNRKDRRAAARQGRPPAGGARLAALISDGVRHHEAGRLAEAGACYQKALALDGGNPDALHLFGLVCLQTGDAEGAVTLIGRALAQREDVALYRLNMGTALRTLGRDAEAAEHYRRAAELDPGDASAWVGLGDALDGSGRTDAALAAYGEALRRDGDCADAHIALTGLLVRTGDLVRARRHGERAVALDPSSPVARNNLGSLLLAEGRPSEAIAAYREAVTLDPAYGEGWINLGALLADQQRAAEAAQALRTGLGLRPDSAYGWESLALLLGEEGRNAEAVEALQRAVAIAPERVNAVIDLGNAMRRLGRIDDAIGFFDRALAMDPANDHAAENRALALLAKGEFARGWDDYRRRDSIVNVRPRLTQDALPDDLGGRRLYLLRDQGLGDEIFFLRFLPALRRRGPWIAYRTQPPLAGMVERTALVDRLIVEGRDAEITDADLTISVGDLPWLLGMRSAADIPLSVTLSPLADRLADLRARLEAAGSRPWIGVTWRAGVQQRERLSKIAPQDGLAAALRAAPGTLIALQRQPLPGEIERFAAGADRPLHDFTAFNEDLEGMLALLDLVDDYVCVSNTNVHLRAGCGKTCRVLVPSPAEYRWMAAGDASPWFPGSPVYRQQPGGDWADAMARLAADLGAGGQG